MLLRGLPTAPIVIEPYVNEPPYNKNSRAGLPTAPIVIE